MRSLARQKPMSFIFGLARLGSLLILPTLEQTGLLRLAKKTYCSLSDGFYSLSATILTMVFLAVCREMVDASFESEIHSTNNKKRCFQPKSHCPLT